jgi:hypothetical protein
MFPLKQFFARSGPERRLFVEALIELCRAKTLVHTVPFRRLAPTFGRPQAETAGAIAPADRAIAVQVSWAVQCAARHVPLGFVCLPQAIAGQRMLRRRGVGSTLYLGVASDRAKPEAITAHAWLRAGDKIVSGEREAAHHRRLASFAGPPFS